MRPTIQNVFFVVGTTLLTMFALNQVAGLFPLGRRAIRGASVFAVPPPAGFNLVGGFPEGTFT